MGSGMSRVYGALVRRPSQRFNVEERAHRVITKIEDPEGEAMRAPRFKADEDLLNEIRRTKPELKEATQRKDEDLLSRLQHVYVTSSDPEIKQEESLDKPLPKDRVQHYEDFVPPVLRAEEVTPEVPAGRLSVGQAVSLLTKLKEDPTHGAKSRLAEEYRLSQDVVSSLVTHFGVFSMHVPVVEEPQRVPDPLKAGKDWVERAQDPDLYSFKHLEAPEQEKKMTAEKVRETYAKEGHSYELLDKPDKKKKKPS